MANNPDLSSYLGEIPYPALIYCFTGRATLLVLIHHAVKYYVYKTFQFQLPGRFKHIRLFGLLKIEL